jgi:hypothetical protein
MPGVAATFERLKSVLGAKGKSSCRAIGIKIAVENRTIDINLLEEISPAPPIVDQLTLRTFAYYWKGSILIRTSTRDLQTPLTSPENIPSTPLPDF